MGLARIAWRNLWRHKRRTIITASGMGLAMGLVLAMSCMQDGMFGMLADVMIRQQSGHVQLSHPDWPSQQLLYDTIPQKTQSTVAAGPGVQGAAGRLFSYGLAASEENSVGARYVGVDPEAERAIRPFESSVVAGRWLGDEAAGEIVIGVEMGRELELELGEELVFLGQAADGSMANELLTIVGMFSTGVNQMDRSGAYLHVVDMQRILALEGQVHQILVVGSSFEGSEVLAEDARSMVAGEADILVRTWQEADPSTAQMMGARDIGLFVMLFIVFSVAGLSVLNTMLMTVFERSRELGVLRAIGMSRLSMMMLVILESLMLAAVATTIGLVLGGFLDFLLIEYGFPYQTAEGKGLSWNGVTFPPVIRGAVEARPIVITVVFLNVVALLSALWPAVRVARLKPVDAMEQH